LEPERNRTLRQGRGAIGSDQCARTHSGGLSRNQLLQHIESHRLAAEVIVGEHQVDRTRPHDLARLHRRADTKHVDSPTRQQLTHGIENVWIVLHT